MAIFKRKAGPGVLDLRRTAVVCPQCGGPSSTDYVDLVLQKSLHTCRRCAQLWEHTVQEHATA